MRAVFSASIASRSRVLNSDQARGSRRKWKSTGELGSGDGPTLARPQSVKPSSAIPSSSKSDSSADEASVLIGREGYIYRLTIETPFGEPR